MQVVLPAGTDLYLTGGKSHDSEIRFAKFLIMNTKPGSTFIDVGAHFGYFSLLVAHLTGNNGKVFSFEASKENIKIFKENTAGVNNIIPFNKAISDKSEIIEFYEFPVLFSEFNTMNVAQFKNQNWIEKYKPEKLQIPAVTIDSFVSEQKAIPAIIKIDVEGAEFKVVSGAKETLTQYSPMVIMEFLEKSRHNEEHEKAALFMKELGYKSYVILNDGSLKEANELNAYLIATGQDSDNIVFSKL